MRFWPVASLSGVSLKWRMVAGVCAIISIILLVLSTMTVKQISRDNLEEIKSGIAQVIKSEAVNIESLLSTRYKVLETTFEAPSVVNWLATRETMWEEIENDPQYHQVNAFLKKIVATEDEITSLFYSPLKTKEYWDENGRIPKQVMTSSIESVPWWNKTMEAGTAVVNEPFQDSRTKIVAAAMTKPLYGDSGEQLAIVGIDLKLESIQRLVRQHAKYNNQGEAFLFQENGQLITLPETAQLSRENPRSVLSLSSFDDLASNTGFAQMQSIRQQVEFFSVVWQGKEQLAAVVKLESSEPLMQWRLAILYPQSEIDAPINAAVYQFIGMTLLLLLVIAIVVGVMIHVNMKPLAELNEAMERIVSGDGDLTQRIDVKTRDEIGQLSRLFNKFVANIDSVVRDSLQVSAEVSSSSSAMQSMMKQADTAVQNQNAELDMIAAATTELSQAVNEISQNAENSSQATETVQSQVNQGMMLVTDANEQIKKLASSFKESEQLVSDLNTSSDRIGEVLDVIGSIADQTNLLALNAAIEAARAGEHGRGFAVVADEVRTLAKQTQESTSNIQLIIDSLRNNTKSVLNVMVENRSHAEDSVAHAEQIYTKLSQLTRDVEEIQVQSAEIAESTAQQSQVLDDIAKNIVTTKDFSDDTSKMMNNANNAGGELKQESDNLLQNLQRFKTS